MNQALKQISATETTIPKASDKVIVSFVIPAMNEERWITDCIDSIRNLTLPKTVERLEIIVVDNESVDRTVELSRSKGAKVASCPPGKPSRARNTGAKLAVGDWLAFVDADCCLDSNWLVHCAETICANDTVATGSQIVPPADNGNWVMQTMGRLSRQDGMTEPKQVRWLPTAGLLVKTEHFEAIRGFDEHLVTCEDCDLGYRLSERGRLIFNPSAMLVHYGESKNLNEVLWREAWRTRGNIKLAFNRPGDVRNWIGLLLPVAFVLLVFIGLLGFALALLGSRPLLPSLGILLLGGSIPFVLATRTQTHAMHAEELVRRWIVMTTFLAGRALGLVWRFPRVER